tara:strand:+ start:93 stop:1013 length:921 start_codon:yes stop_codon:yes gene_type:complete
MQFNEFGVPMNPAEESMLPKGGYNLAKKMIAESGIESNIVITGAMMLAGGASFGSSLLGAHGRSRAAVKQFAAQHGRNVYNAHFNKLKVAQHNEDTVRIFKEELKQGKMQMEFNASAAGGAYANIQRNLNTTFARASYAREQLQQRLAHVQGMQAAKGASRRGSSRSANRADLINSLGNFGRQQAKMTASLAGARAAAKEQMAGIGRKHLSSDFQSWAKTAIVPRMAWHGGDARMGSTSHLQGSPLSLLQAGLGAVSAMAPYLPASAGAGAGINPMSDQAGIMADHGMSAADAKTIASGGFVETVF